MNLVDPSCSIGGTALCWQPFGFAGGVWDVTTGIVRFGARDYDPMIRRWTQKDVVKVDEDDSNIYVYGGDDPINQIDQDGKDSDYECYLEVQQQCQSYCWPGPCHQSCATLCTDISDMWICTKRKKKGCNCLCNPDANGVINHYNASSWAKCQEYCVTQGGGTCL